MSRNTSGIDVSITDTSVNSILQGFEPPAPSAHARKTLRYNQSEDQFTILETPLVVPALPVHHSIDNRSPPPGYVDIIAGLASWLAANCPELSAGASWFFNPVTIHTPSFYRIVTHGGQAYLYLFMVDLTCRPLECEILERGTNNRTPAYRSNRLYFECDYFPVRDAVAKGGVYSVQQTIPVTWKGESGEGYMVHGIWMDSDINKFFSKLVLPEGKRNHPFYPVTCKQHCMSMNAAGLDGPESLHRIRQEIEPWLDRILGALQDAPFSEAMPLFREIKSRMPAGLGERWEGLTVQAELNEREQKEYIVEF